MKDSALQTYQLSASKKVLIISLIYLFVLCCIGLAILAYIRGYYETAGIIAFWSIVTIFSGIQCGMSRLRVYDRYCVIRSVFHPRGIKIDWKHIDRIYFRHYAPFLTQRVIIKYRNNKLRLREKVILCEETDNINDLKLYLLPSQIIDDLEEKNKEAAEQKRKQIEELCAVYADNIQHIKEDFCWSDYEKMCHVVNQQFGLLARKIQQAYNLSEREVRVCVLSLFELSYEQMAELLFYAPNGIGKLKVRVANKMGTTAKNLRSFLIKKAINE